VHVGQDVRRRERAGGSPCRGRRRGGGDIFVADAYSGALDFGGASGALAGPPDPDPNGFGLLGSTGIDVFVAGLDSSGVAMWSRSFGTGASQQETILEAYTVDSKGRIGLGVDFQCTIDFGTGTFDAGCCGDYSMAIVALDASGGTTFAHAIKASTGTWLRAMAFDASATLFATGSLPYPADFGAGPVPKDSFSYPDDGMFVASYDTGGQVRGVDVYARTAGASCSQRSRRSASCSSSRFPSWSYHPIRASSANEIRMNWRYISLPLRAS